MSSELIVAVAVGAGSLISLMGLTAVGEHRRGHGVAVAIVAGLLFPITWIVWYARDEHPYRTVHHS